MENKRKPFSKCFIAFLIVAFVFLAIGLGTLGSFQHTGSSYELMTATSTDEENPSVILDLKNPSVIDENGKSSTVYCAISSIYINVGTLYSEEGRDVSFRVNRGSSTDYFSSGSNFEYTVTLENLIPSEPENGKESGAVENSQFNWIAPFEENISKTSTLYTIVSTYHYIKLTAPTHNLLVNEIVFVGEKLVDDSGNNTSSARNRTGEYYLLPVEVYSATPYVGQTYEEAKESAGALIDAQAIPNMAQSTFNRFSKEEIYSLMSIAEMKTGGTYSVNNYYHGDTVYNSLGTSVLAFGTLIFGISQFGLRLFPMLASFGVLMLGFYLARDFFKSEKAGLAFAVLYALCNLSVGLGHLGSPLMLGVFFFTASLFGGYKFFRFGMKKANLSGALPLVLSGLGGAAAICVNGAFLVPMLVVVGLFAAGLVRQQKARRYYLDLAIAEAEAEEKIQPPQAGETSKGREKVARVVSEYRAKNTLAPVAFFVSLVLGALFLSLIFLIPTYYLAVKLFDNPASPSLNLFTLGAKWFAGGFIGTNGGANVWNPVYTVFAGTGGTYAITSIVMNLFAAIAAIAGIAYAIWRIVLICKDEPKWYQKSAFYAVAAPLACLLVCLITAIFAQGGLAFILLAYVCGFLLAAGAVKHFTECEGKTGEAAKIVTVVGIVLLAVWFILSAAFTFSIPLPESFMGIFG